MRHFYSISLMAGLVLLGACNSEQTQVPIHTQIHVTTLPPEALVIFDNTPIGDSPTTIPDTAPGTHILIARKPGYREARKTITTVLGERIAVEIKMEPIHGLLLIHSRPDGADVEINNVTYGKTPLLITDCPLGQHKMKISAPGYLPKVIKLSVSDQTPQKIDVPLTTDSARVLVESIPQGAQVTIDSASYGNTPCTIPALPTGKHRLTINLKGYSSYSETFTIRAGDSRKISPRLISLPGSLTLTSIPEKARIYINDTFYGLAPFSSNKIMPGTYIVRAELDGYESRVSTNIISYGQETVVEFKMVKNSGIIVLTTQPPEVNIYLDGKLQGATKRQEDKLISQELRMDFVPRGKRVLQLTKNGYYTLTKTVTVEPDQTVVVYERLTRRPVPFAPNTIIRTGPGPEHTFYGIIREKYKNGDIKFEIEPGIFKLFRSSEIISVEHIPQNK